MSRYDSRSVDPASYRDRRSDSGFGGSSNYRAGTREADCSQPQRKVDLDGLIPFEKNFYVESPSVAAMSESEVEEYRLKREITVDGRQVPKPVTSFRDIGFPGIGAMAAPVKSLGLEKSDAMSDWTIVLPRRGRQKRKEIKSVLSKDEEPAHTWTPDDDDKNPERERKLLHKMDICIQKLENSQFWKSLLNQMGSPEFLNRVISLLGTEASMKMVVYGIGSIESYDPPRLQLGVVILMKRNFGWIGDVEVFDPIISLTESKVLDSLGCSVLSLNEQGRRRALRPTFFFMPHCEAELYDNLLQANWRAEMLNRTVLFGNSFDEYEQYMSLCRTSTIAEPRKHILAVRKFTTEVRIRADFDEYYRAFNGSSWHFFSVDSELDSLH